VRRNNIHISVYFLIPAIFSGISIIAVILAYRIASQSLQIGIASDVQIIWFGIAIAALTYFCSFLIIRFILGPIVYFVKNAEKLPIISQHSDVVDNSSRPESIEHLHLVLDQVTTILGKVEAKELFPKIIGQSRAMREIFGQIIKVAPTDSTVLISGDSGTGKELVATGIFEHSIRREKPFIRINCVAIPEGLLESELFGHEKGSFTGAVAQKKGKFELADGGTIFLDEIGDMPPATQAKLLRVLQERVFERVGGTKPIRVDVRFIAATNKNLTEMVKAGTFRDDLYYRINVFNVHLPALRDRREDIPALVERFLVSSGKNVRVSPQTMQLLLRYRWPGNVRELQNVIERAAVIAEETIDPIHLPISFSNGMKAPRLGMGSESEISLDDRLAEIEKGMIIEALTRVGGVQVHAAERLGINQRSLWHRIKKHGIDVSFLKKLQNM
jgi:transcriptional regulator with PAS, ATPase and Fis domain